MKTEQESAAQSLRAFRTIVSKTGFTSVGDRLITRKISLVAVCCSRASVTWGVGRRERLVLLLKFREQPDVLNRDDSLVGEGLHQLDLRVRERTDDSPRHRDRRWAELRLDRLPALATELVQLKVDLILTIAGAETIAAKAATKTIPIVMGSSLDPVEQGLVASLSRPGGNVTGVTSMTEELSGRRLAFLREAAPKVSRIAVLKCRGLLVGQGFGGMLDAASALGVNPKLLEREAEDYETAFAAAIREGAGAMVVLSCYFNAANTPRIVALATKHRLPAISSLRGWAESGGLMSYGPSPTEQAKLTATYVDKVLKGAKPAALPVEQPTKFELIINMKTAKALGLKIPRTLLLRADRVIE